MELASKPRGHPELPGHREAELPGGDPGAAELQANGGQGVSELLGRDRGA